MNSTSLRGRLLWLAHRDYCHPKSGGAERTAFETGRGLTSRGYPVTIISSHWRGGPTSEVRSGVKLRRFPTVVGPHLLYPIVQLGFRPRWTVADLAHAVPWVSAPILQRGVIVFFRHLHARTLGGQVPTAAARLLSVIERLYPTIYRSAPFVTESLSSAKDLEILGIERSRIHLIPPGVDCLTFRPGKRSETAELVYFGGFRDYKRPLHFLEALRILAQDDPEIHGVMIGTGPNIGRVMDRSTQLGLKSRVSFVGRVNDNDLVNLVARAWVNVHCSTAEGWCLSAIEAAACGVPTVGYDVPGLRDSTAAGKSGLLVKDGDVDGLAAAIRSVVVDPDSWRSRSRQHAERFTWQNCVDMWVKLLGECT